MLLNGTSISLIKGIPAWLGGDAVPSDMSSPSAPKLVEVIPESDKLVNFADDVWDFREYFVMQYDIKNTISFKECDAATAPFLKAFTVWMMDENTKISTLHDRIPRLARILRRAGELSGRGSFLLAGTDDFMEAAEGYTNPMMCFDSLNYLGLFAGFLRDNAGIVLNLDMTRLRSAKKFYGDMCSGHRERNSHPDIPADLFEDLTRMFVRVMKDEQAPLNDRLTAGLMFIESQTGLRISELCCLQVDCLQYGEADDGTTRPLIRYNSIKKAHGSVESVPAMTFCTEECEAAVQYYLELRKGCKYASETDFLYIQDDKAGRKCNGRFPVSKSELHERVELLCLRYAGDAICKPRTDFPSKVVSSRKIRCHLPTIHSYRVHFASECRKCGVPVDFIESAMSHSPQEYYTNYYSGLGMYFHDYRTGRSAITAEARNDFNQYLNDLIDFANDGQEKE